MEQRYIKEEIRNLSSEHQNELLNILQDKYDENKIADIMAGKIVDIEETLKEIGAVRANVTADDLPESLMLYLDARIDCYKELNVVPGRYTLIDMALSSNHREDNYLYSIMAKKTRNDDTVEYVTWQWNNSLKSLNHGHYDIITYEAAYKDFISRTIRNENKSISDNFVNEQTDGLAVEGHFGTWHTIDSHVIDSDEYFLMEHDTYGDETACIVVNKTGDLVAEDVWEAFSEECISSIREFVSDSNIYTFEISEELRKTVKISAKSEDEATKILESKYMSGEIVLTADDFVQREFLYQGREEAVQKKSKNRSR